MKYIIVYEQSNNNWAAYVPDVPGCVAAADTRDEVKSLITEALEGHLGLLRAYGESVPEPGAWTDVVEVKLPDGAQIQR